MLKRPSDTHFLFITLILVLLMGVPTFHTLMANDEIAELQMPVEATQGAVGSSRQPASVPAKTSSLPTSALSYFTQYDLSCAKKSLSKLKVSGSYVQFQGKNCLKNFKNGDVEIVNKSNGFTASVFSSGSDKYQTDLIQLQNGDNEIGIRYRERSGKAVEEVVRISASQI